MSATINQCLAELKEACETAVLANAIYDYRTFPDKLSAAVTLSYQGGSPEGKTLAGDSLYYDVTAVCMVQCVLDDNGNVTETALRNAEQALNTIENGLYSLLGKGGAARQTDYWFSVSFPRPSSRPPSAPEAVTNRQALIPFRLHLI